VEFDLDERLLFSGGSAMMWSKNRVGIYGWVAALLSLPTVWAVLYAETETCNTEDCEYGCKEHDRFCSSKEQTIFKEKIAVKLCCESPDGGKPVEYAEVKYDNYSKCTRDCEEDSPTTGAPHGDRIGGDSAVVKTRCSES